MNCQGCGVDLDPTQEHIDSAVDQILETSLKDAQQKGGVCPLCGHSKEVPFPHRKPVLFALLATCVVILTAAALVLWQSRQTGRSAVVNELIARMDSNAGIVGLLGTPITAKSGVSGDIKHDETGWKEVRLTVPVRGPKGEALVHVIGGAGTGPWVFTTFEVVFEKQHKKLDLLSGSVVEYDPNAYVEIHTQTAIRPEYSNAVAAAPRFDGEFPCVFASVGKGGVIPALGKCEIPTVHAGVVDRFEVDLRIGAFVLRQSDLYLNDVFEVPLTRSYNSRDWMAKNRVHAFGRNSNHPYDIAPLGSRNPYTYQMIALEDSDFIYFDRISKGTGYADAVFQHTETSTRFYKSVTSWNGNGWTTKLADGSEIRFPESYNAKNLAQGAATEMLDAKGNRLELRRDGQRNLQQIATPNGHTIKFNYDDLSRIIRAEDDKGNWVKYSYNGDGMLETATFSSGQMRRYDYMGALMTAVMDEKGNVLVRNSYESERLTRQQFANGDTFRYSYDWASDRYYPDKVVVTLPDQTTREVRVEDSVSVFLKNKLYRP
jgi:YD repeat-containing protein